MAIVIARTTVQTLLALFAIAVLSPAAWAQAVPGEGYSSDQQGGIAGNGAAVVKRPPTLLRMYLIVKGKGKNAEQALASLQERRGAAVAELQKLGADPKTIDTGSPSVSREDAERQRQLEQMLRGRMRSRGKGGKKVKLPETVTLMSVLTAQWPLAEKPAEELFITVQKLESQVKAARLGTGKEADRQSEEEKELAEEMGAELDQMMSYRGDAGDPNTPYFFYVAQIPPEKRAQALAEAFQKAKADAQRMAQATGLTLGTLVNLMTTATTGGSEPSYQFQGRMGNEMPRAIQELVNQQHYPGRRGNREDEAMARRPDGIVYQFTVAASFAQAKAGGAGAARAAAPRTGEMVSGTGTAVVQKFPTTMRMTMHIPSKGKNLEEALADLNQRRQAAFAELEKLGAKKESLRLSVPSVTLMDAQTRRQFEQMMVVSSRPTRGRSAGDKTPKAPETVMLHAGLTAEWPVEAKNTEGLFVAVHQLREKIDAAKWAASPPAVAPSPERQTSPALEITPEQAVPVTVSEMGEDMPGASPENPTPTFVFVATITDEERQKALGQAVEKAKGDAARVAQSAGARVGPLVAINSGSGSYRYGGFFPGGFMPSYLDPDSAWKENEGVAGQPGTVKFPFTVSVGFAVQNAAEQPAGDKDR